MNSTMLESRINVKLKWISPNHGAGDLNVSGFSKTRSKIFKERIKQRVENKGIKTEAQFENSPLYVDL